MVLDSVGAEVAAQRFDPEGPGDPADLRVFGWAWYALGSALFLVGTDQADPARRPRLGDSDQGPFWRLSELARIVEEGDADQTRVQMARELLGGVMADLAADAGLGRGAGGA